MKSILERLSRVVESHVPLQVLDAASEMIAAEVDADSCSIFLLNPPSTQIELRSGFGHLALSDTLKSAAQALASEALAEMRPTRAETPSDALLAVPMVVRGRPLGAIVAQATGHPFSAERERTLCAIAAHMVGIVESTRFIEAVDNEGAVEDYLVMNAVDSAELSGELVLQGTPASPGIAISARRISPRSKSACRGSLPISRRAIRRSCSISSSTMRCSTR